MDVKLLHKHFYDLWIGRSILFETIDGKSYEGELSNWLEDGTLLFTTLRRYDSNGKCVDQWDAELLFNFEQIQFISCLDTSRGVHHQCNGESAEL
ncbi:MAG TPA: hypothetical protein VEG44_04145 [Candidatus Acidoferrales bacterium]|nr:hypothetical protein [Candidatus Acidoferrales bacterium]